ncbi:hypothetical protein B5C34_12945 [Pacificimonas flava]|uniref:PRC-barrel domain-containing protein n=2 Tax=Pacificimonas TaxID=1960290 RepID=A0A219B7Y7_9SPHN|nr:MULTISPECIES: PRC-barrel domain-containing protein [Pacificimonas]MBZ6378424.1 PRC-barrel domain-containing protein [Pacificimonas aurantium]OWV34273.1 hypothetical protein B5C34_12945 [Pacificimonas flava]
MKHEERYEELDRLGDWKLVDSDQDIRGRPLVDEAGLEFGIVDDMIVDKDKEHVVAIALKDGRMCGVEYLDIRPDRVVYREPAAGYTPTYSRVHR